MKNFSIALLFVLCISENLMGMDEVKPLPLSGGPMNAEWFYHPDNPFKKANDLHQKRQWQAAASEYELTLSVKRTDKYSCNMAKVNLAACLMAQKKPSKHWRSFDALLEIPKEKHLPKKIFEDPTQLLGKIVKVRTDKVGIGDIFHFMEAADALQRRVGCSVVFSVRDFLKDTLFSVATAYNFALVKENSDILPFCDYETHIISLLGHLQLSPSQTAPERVVLASPERAMVAVAQQINPLLAQGKTLAMVYIGENRSATLMGGKQLPYDTTKQGRNLNSESFKALLRNHSNLVIIDCG